ncbi:kelch domain-containing protein 1 [Caerostris darwini]|uniref:Kelch domain-containing protein 1 n=1 Tax=Caerostris darwini TaxID=1538125 RepID=A0AAV4RC46_9ARAC|nr:kelch domain-containing protein 1 [Caerostris darwini]
MVQLLNPDMVSAGPPGRTGHIAVSYENYVLVWGGYRENPGVASNTYFSGAELYIYSCISEKWYLKKNGNVSFPPGMSGSTAVVIDDALYVFGGYGYHGQGCTNLLFKFDLETFIWSAVEPEGVPPIPVDKMAGWQYNKKFYVFGGFGNPDTGPSHEFQFVFYHLLWRGWTNQFFEYDPKKNTWSKPFTTGTLPSARAAHAAAVMQGKVYIFGGRHDVHRMNDMHCLDMEIMHWSGELPIKGPVPMGRSWHSLTALSERYLVLYGGFSQNNIVLSDCWRFDTVNHTWQPIELPFEKPRLWHCACLSIFDEVLIFGGCTTNILDLERTPEQATDIVVIRTYPKSLFRSCVDKTIDFPCNIWETLPHNIQSVLQLRFGYRSRHLIGS